MDTDSKPAKMTNESIRKIVLTSLLVFAILAWIVFAVSLGILHDEVSPYTGYIAGLWGLVICQMIAVTAAVVMAWKKHNPLVLRIIVTAIVALLLFSILVSLGSRAGRLFSDADILFNYTNSRGFAYKGYFHKVVRCHRATASGMILSLVADLGLLTALITYFVMDTVAESKANRQARQVAVPGQQFMINPATGNTYVMQMTAQGQPVNPNMYTTTTAYVQGPASMTSVNADGQPVIQYVDANGNPVYALDSVPQQVVDNNGPPSYAQDNVPQQAMNTVGQPIYNNQVEAPPAGMQPEMPQQGPVVQIQPPQVQQDQMGPGFVQV